MNDQKNMILAIVLSAAVLILWQFFFVNPQMERQRQAAQQQAQQQQTQPGTTTPPAQPGGTPTSPGTQPGQPTTTPVQPLTREAALAASPRIPLDTPSLAGSIALKGGRIDDLSLKKFRETIEPTSPLIVLLAPVGSPHPFFAEFGWLPPTGASIKRPDENTLWAQQGAGPLTTDRPVTLVYDNGEGLEFRRTIAVDDKYLFTIKDEVANKGDAPVTLYPYALIGRHGQPKVEGYYISHEGLIGYMGEKGLKDDSYTYAKMDEKKLEDFGSVTNAWLGITDKYWAAALIPDTTTKISARFTARAIGTLKTYEAAYNVSDPQAIAPGTTAAANVRLFAGAKEVAVIDSYNDALQLNHFDKIIDWGWFYFLTKPLFQAMEWIFHRVGNFGIAILLITVLIKGLFFPLANKSYASMAKMKAVQPEMTAIRERYGDDKMKQQQAMMELYKKEKINPIAGCLPILVQVPVFFALYKVLFITIEMRHAPFYGWIKDLSAPDPTTVFNLFGLIPFDPSHLPVVGPFLMLGAWPLVMGVTMWFQMKLNPPPPDPTQKMIFDWMPIIFTFMLAGFSAGLVIYWAWNNTLSVIQQSIIMQKHGAKIELFENIKAMFAKKNAQG
jgi:YidC/Oxa1 family membrane protein insertase